MTRLCILSNIQTCVIYKTNSSSSQLPCNTHKYFFNNLSDFPNQDSILTISMLGLFLSFLAFWLLYNNQEMKIDSMMGTYLSWSDNLSPKTHQYTDNYTNRRYFHTSHCFDRVMIYKGLYLKHVTITR